MEQLLRKPREARLPETLIRSVRLEKQEMTNRWGIPSWLEHEVKERDKTCIYCGIELLDRMPPNGSRSSVGTWEHIINDASIVTRENIARCCAACNSSKGTKSLAEWLQSTYCERKGISKETIADVAKESLNN